MAAGGTLGILIPPSTGMIIYAILTEQSIGRLFMAGVFPGLLLTGLFLIAIYIVTTRRPEAGPPGPRADFAHKMKTLRRTGVIVGINAPQRIELSASAVPGDKYVIACLVANGPLAEPRGGIFMRFATLAFESTG